MAFTTRVTITVKKDILDPAGEAVKKMLRQQNILSVTDVRIGKVVDISLDPAQELTAQLAKLHEMARKILSNPIMEDVTIELLDEPKNDS